MTTAVAGAVTIGFGGQKMVLLPGKAVYWCEAQCLIVADVHLGKASSFRSWGVPVPTGGTGRDLERLTRLLATTGAARLAILGDLLHAKAGRDPEMLEEVAQWRNEHAAIEMLLVRGNHDRAAGRVPAEWRMREVEEPHLENGVALLHNPERETEWPGLAGHVHPVTTVRDFDGSCTHIPSFIQDADRLILPAFGSFTGGYAMHAADGREIFLAARERVVRAKRLGVKPMGQKHQ